MSARMDFTDSSGPALGAETSLRERVRANPPPWAAERIAAWDELAWWQASGFFAETYSQDCGSIDVFRVQGVTESEYQGKTWAELLEQAPRTEQHLARLAEDPDYYQDTAVQGPRMRFVSLDGINWYFDGPEGLRRLCIARFDLFYRGGSMLQGVELRCYRVDEAMMALREAIETRLRKLSLGEIQTHCEPCGYEEGPGWILNRNRVELRVRETASGKQIILSSADEARHYLKDLLAYSPLRRLRGLLRFWGHRT